MEFEKKEENKTLVYISVTLIEDEDVSFGEPVFRLWFVTNSLKEAQRLQEGELIKFNSEKWRGEYEEFLPENAIEVYREVDESDSNKFTDDFVFVCEL